MAAQLDELDRKILGELQADADQSLDEIAGKVGSSKTPVWNRIRRMREQGVILRQTVIALASGQQLNEHENPGEATVHVLHGRVRLAAGDVSWEGSPGDLLVVPEESHSLLALEDAAILLTVAKRG